MNEHLESSVRHVTDVSGHADSIAQQATESASNARRVRTEIEESGSQISQARLNWTEWSPVFKRMLNSAGNWWWN